MSRPKSFTTAQALNALQPARHIARALVLEAEAALERAKAGATDLEVRVQLAQVEHDEAMREERDRTMRGLTDMADRAARQSCECARCRAERAAAN